MKLGHIRRGFGGYMSIFDKDENLIFNTDRTRDTFDLIMDESEWDRMIKTLKESDLTHIRHKGENMPLVDWYKLWT